MPKKMEELLDMLGVAPNARQFDNARLDSDSSYGNAERNGKSEETDF